MDSLILGLHTLDTAFWITAACIFLLLICSAFFSGSETALTAASRGKLHAMADKGEKGAQEALELREDSERMIGAILLGNNLVNILATALATAMFTRLFGDGAVALASLIMTILVLVFAEVLPKTYAINNSERAAKRVAAPLQKLVFILYPIVFAVQKLVNMFLKALGGLPDDDDKSDAAQEEIAGAIALGHQEGDFQKDDRDRLLGALDLKDREVEEIMLHRSDIQMIDIADAPDAIIRTCLASSYTRLPIFEDTPENIIGVIHTKDLLREVELKRMDASDPAKALADVDIRAVAMKPYFVPETTTLDDQMREFLRRKTHFALVVDEYGTLQGLITLEDILEEIVGEIHDEHDDQQEEIATKDAMGDYIIDGSATIRDVNRAHDWSLPDEEANTIAGLVIHEAQMIPSEGQVFSFHGMRFEVLTRDKNRIKELKLRVL